MSKVDPEAVTTAHRNLAARIGSREVGFYGWAGEDHSELLGRIKTTVEGFQRDTDAVICFGIGGSYLGPSCLLEALRSPSQKERYPMEWLCNADPASIERCSHFLHQRRKVAGVVISKSGGTTETLSGFIHLSKHLDSNHIAVVTDPDSGELCRLAKQHQWKHFEIPKNIGGRFSVLTAVGLLPCALGSIPVERILNGAREMKEALDRSAATANPALLFAFALFRWNREGKSVVYLMPYTSQLKQLSDWFVQLWAESIGKPLRADPKTHVGFTPVAALGTSDQHSVLQLMKEGPSDKIVGFVDVAEAPSATIGEPAFGLAPEFRYLCRHTFKDLAHQACLATEKSLQNSGVPTFRFQMEQVTPEALGAFLFFMETACAYAGELYGVNAFNQPGVEESKRLLQRALR